MVMDMLRSTIDEQRRRLEQELHEPLDRIARGLSQVWADREALTAVLTEAIRTSAWPFPASLTPRMH